MADQPITKSIGTVARNAVFGALCHLVLLQFTPVQCFNICISFIRPCALITSTRCSSSSSSSYFLEKYTLSSYQPSTSQHQSSSPTILFAEKKYPMIVTGNASCALGAAMALCTREMLIKSSSSTDEENSKEEAKEERPPVPPAQLIALCNHHPGQDSTLREELSPSVEESLQNALLFGQFEPMEASPKINDYKQILSSMNEFLSCIYSDHENDYGKPIFHTSIGNKCGLNLENILDDVIRNSISYLGLHLQMDHVRSDDDEHKFILPKDDAIEWGDILQRVLDGGTPAAVTMDISTHLAFLQANRLAKCRNNVLGVNDVWAIQGDIVDGLKAETGDCMLFEYKYDFDNPFGGADPLLCPSKSYMIDSTSLSLALRSKLNDDQKANDAFSGAYSALRGSGMEHIPSLCVASSVKAVFCSEHNNGILSEDGDESSVSYTWDTIERITDLSRQARLNAFEEDGAPRKKYREFGYK